MLNELSPAGYVDGDMNGAVCFEESDPQQAEWETREEERAARIQREEREARMPHFPYVPFKDHTLEGFRDRMRLRMAAAGWKTKDLT